MKVRSDCTILLLTLFLSAGIACQTANQSSAARVAPAPLPTSPPAIRTLCLQSEESYEGKPQLRLPALRTTAMRVWKYTGVRVVSGGACDAQLKITARGRALAGDYEFGESQSRHFAGAEIAGDVEVRMIATNRVLFHSAFQNRKTPGIFISRKYPTPASAPYGKALLEEDGFANSLVTMLLRLYGMPPVRKAMNDPLSGVREAAIEYAGEYADSASIPALLRMMRKARSSSDCYAPAEAIYKMDDPRINSILFEFLNDDACSGHSVRHIVLRRPAGTVEAIGAAIRKHSQRGSSGYFSARYIVHNAGELGDPDLTPHLVWYLRLAHKRNLDESHARAAVDALRAVTGRNFGDSATDYEQWYAARQK